MWAVPIKRAKNNGIIKMNSNRFQMMCALYIPPIRPENAYLLHKGKYYCSGEVLFHWFGFDWTSVNLLLIQHNKAAGSWKPVKLEVSCTVMLPLQSKRVLSALALPTDIVVNDWQWLRRIFRWSMPYLSLTLFNDPFPLSISLSFYRRRYGWIPVDCLL